MDIAPGDFFFHSEYGVGQVSQVDEGVETEVELIFKGRPPLQMTEFLIRRNLTGLSPSGFRAFAYIDPEAAERLIANNPSEVIRRTLEDCPANKAKTYELEDYLKPYVKDWDAWWEKNQPLLKDDPRIDTSNSRLREYALHREVKSPAEEAYRSFHTSNQARIQPAELAERARSALALHFKGNPLPQDHVDELMGYLMQVVSFERYDLALRLGTLFRMIEDRWIPKEEANEWLEKLLGRDLKLYQMEPYTAQRIIEVLLRSPLQAREIEILASGMGSNEKTIRYLVDWVLKKSDPATISKFLIAALSLNLPPDLALDKYPTLQTRLGQCLILVKSLPESISAWPEIVRAFQDHCLALSSKSKLDGIYFLLPELLELAVMLNQRVEHVHAEGLPSIIDSLSNPEYPIEFILALLDTANKRKSVHELAHRIFDNVLQKADERQDNFLDSLIDARWTDPKDQLAGLVHLVQKYSSSILTKRGGDKAISLALKAKDEELVDLLPYLDQLHLVPGAWPWQTALESLREKGYLAMFREPVDHAAYRDEALINAAHELANIRLIEINQEIRNQQVELGQFQDRVRELQALIGEKDAVLRELRGNVGGDTEEARFEERSRILKDLVNSIAEFERYAASRPTTSQEIDAVLKRITSILGTYKVTATEPIGSQVAFNPQMHRLVEAAGIAPGDAVKIVEKGFLIRDHRERLRLLKPALVKKI